MTPRLSATIALGATLVFVSMAQAGNPGPMARQQLLGLGSCPGGAPPIRLCVDDSDCSTEGARGVCPTPLANVAVRGVLTLVSDKDSGRWEDTVAVPEVKDADGNVVPADFTRSTLTVVLEFVKDGQRFVLAETFQDLGDHANPALQIDCKGFCVPGWRDPAVESRIATPSEETSEGTGGGTGGGGGQASSPGIRISFATPPPALGAALRQALGLPPGATPFLEVVNTTAIFDHSREQDPLASVRRLKVTIRALLPESTP